MNTFTNIQAALETKLSTIPNLPPVAWPNKDFKPKHLETYIRPTLLVGASELYTLNNESQYSGIYQIDVYTQLDKGSKVLNQWLDTFKDAFYRQTLTSNGVRVFIQEISYGQTSRQDAWYAGFIEINFICYD